MDPDHVNKLSAHLGAANDARRKLVESTVNKAGKNFHASFVDQVAENNCIAFSHDALMQRVLHGIHPCEVTITSVKVEFTTSAIVSKVCILDAPLTASVPFTTINGPGDLTTSGYIVQPHDSFSATINYTSEMREAKEWRARHGYETNSHHLQLHETVTSEDGAETTIPVFMVKNNIFPCVSSGNALKSSVPFVFHGDTGGQEVPAITVQTAEFKKLLAEAEKTETYEENGLCIMFTKNPGKVSFSLSITVNSTYSPMAQTSILDLIEYEEGSDDSGSDALQVNEANQDALKLIELLEPVCIVKRSDKGKTTFLPGFQPSPKNKKGWQTFVKIPGFFEAKSKCEHSNTKPSFCATLEKLAKLHPVVEAASNFFGKVLEYYTLVADTADPANSAAHLRDRPTENLPHHFVPKHIKDCKKKNSVCKMIHIADIYLLCLLKSCETDRAGRTDPTDYEKVITQLLNNFTPEVRGTGKRLKADPVHYLYQMTHQHVREKHDPTDPSTTDIQKINIMAKVRQAKNVILKSVEAGNPFDVPFLGSAYYGSSSEGQDHGVF